MPTFDANFLFLFFQLQEAVSSMKTSLKDAVTNLSHVVSDASSGAQLEEVKQKCEGNSAEILKMVLALRTDLSSLKYVSKIVLK